MIKKVPTYDLNDSLDEVPGGTDFGKFEGQGKDEYEGNSILIFENMIVHCVGYSLHGEGFSYISYIPRKEGV